MFTTLVGRLFLNDSRLNNFRSSCVSGGNSGFFQIFADDTLVNSVQINRFLFIGYDNVYPESGICVGAEAEFIAVIVTKFVVAFIHTRGGRSFQVDGNIDRIAGVHIDLLVAVDLIFRAGSRSGVSTGRPDLSSAVKAEIIAIEEADKIIFIPNAGTAVLHLPGLAEGFARGDHAAICKCHIFDGADLVVAVRIAAGLIRRSLTVAGRLTEAGAGTVCPGFHRNPNRGLPVAADAEECSVRRLEHPLAGNGSAIGRGSQTNTDVHAAARSNIVRNICTDGIHRVTGNEDQLRVGVPGLGTDIADTPGFHE